MIKYLLTLTGALFNIIILGSVTASLMIFLLFSYYGTNLPTVEELKNYKPATLSRVYDKDGNVLGTFGQKNRIYTPVEDIPSLIKDAFISAEDKNFYTHSGYDLLGLLKAITDAFRGKKLRGASTITQQVMKNFLLSGERTGKRKIKEIILASRIEKVLTKDQILNIYLNEIYLGQGAYGVTAAAITYFDKKLDQLNIGEAAFLAALPKAPSFYHPIRQKERSTQRRNFVIKELTENGYISLSDAEVSVNSDLSTIIGAGRTKKVFSLKKNSSYFTDAVKKSILQKYSEKSLKTSGLTIRSTLDLSLQTFARSALQKELIKYDQNLGIYRGPITRVNQEFTSIESAKQMLSELKLKLPVDAWSIAIVRKVLSTYAEIVILKKDNKHEISKLYFKNLNWIKKQIMPNTKVVSVINSATILKKGDIVFVERASESLDKATRWSLRQLPEVQGAFMVMEPNSGKILAMQGGFSYAVSPFNRAIQAKRQPGSLFKPFVYLAALENGYKPNSIIVDAPISVKQAKGVWRPQNASVDWFGVAPLRKGLEYSRNLMTVRLAKVVGMREIKRYAELFGIYQNMPTLLSYSLGSGETTLLKLIRAYSILANGGLEVEPTFFDLVHDRFGNNLYKHGHLRCLGCEPSKASKDGTELKPIFLNMAKRLVDPVSIFQINSMLKGVVERGTASRTVGMLGLPIAGKTGTTNKSKDVWFIGYTPKIVAGCYIGYDSPRSLGKNASGGSLCGNVFKSFIENAYEKKLSVNWKIPKGVELLTIDYDTGEFQLENNEKTIEEIFRAGQTISDIKQNDVIDGGFGMGSDLLFFNQPKDDGKINKSFIRRSFGAISTGDQY